MTLFNFAQLLVIPLVVILSGLKILKTYAPGFLFNRQLDLAIAVQKIGLKHHNRTIRNVGFRLQPVKTNPEGCGSGCDSCKMCARGQSDSDPA